ncbi:SDR family oxidoreductase [Stappia sp. ES.058]|uniref:SDR family oxidoreductase n=1 Tax=Stappia sp. ES.058 TaxID=1881061 RepID=UPI00087CEAE7|nr:SDR family oxidoreductase [Stappia sp. ES.058]SDU49353.1 NADP-dependent 3-hydroxy acid dehydrogenase YdfG [Stappia sp. ES.058]
MSEFENKTVVITGASRGIGEAAARHLAALGANVVLAARSVGDIERIAAEIEKAGGKATAFACDVSRYDDVKALIARAVDLYGRLDVLVNNAGLIEPIARLADSDPEGWCQVVDVNVKGVYFGLRCAIPEMTARGGGTIINISSGAATGALEGWSHYCATKAAVLSLTRCTDKEYRGEGIRMIGLSPGTVKTEMQVAIKKSGVNPVSQLDPSVHIPPEWVAQTIAYLCGPEGDAYLGTDFSLKTDEGRAAVGLPAVS